MTDLSAQIAIEDNVYDLLRYLMPLYENIDHDMPDEVIEEAKKALPLMEQLVLKLKETKLTQSELLGF